MASYRTAATVQRPTQPLRPAPRTGSTMRQERSGPVAPGRPGAGDGAMEVNAMVPSRAPAMTAPAAGSTPVRTAQPYNRAAADRATESAWQGRSGQTSRQGANPYNPNAPRYQGIDDQDIAWANTALTARRPDGSFVYKGSERNHAQEQIVDRMRDQDRALADPMSGQSLRGRAGAFMDRLGGNMDAAGAEYEQYSDLYGEIDRGTGQRIARMDGYRPDMLEEFDPSFLRDQRPDALEGWSAGGLDGFRSERTEGWSPTNLRGVDTRGVRDFDAGGTMRGYLDGSGGAQSWNTNATGATSGFDPRMAMEEFARGAAGQAKFVLADQLEAAENSAARRGRLNTGFFDREKGSVIRRVGEDLNNQIATRAVDAAGIRAQIENANTRNLTDASIASARERGNMGQSMAQLRSNEARDAARLGLDARTSATGYDVDIADAIDRLSLDQGQSIDRNSLTAADRTATLSLDRAGEIDRFRQRGAESFADTELRRREGIDDRRYTARRDAADASIRRGNSANDRLNISSRLWGDAQDRFGDALYGERDRVTGQENSERELAAQDRQGRRDTWGKIIGGVGAIGGAVIGGMVGGPAGAAAGASVGGRLGGR
jgi:hypothetical protein